jgi:hypothetical protein
MPYTNATGTAAVVVSYPSPSGTPHAYLINTSPQVAYVGGQYVTSVSGLPLYPNNRMDLAFMPGTAYAVAGFSQSATVFGTVQTAVQQGGTSFTTSGAPGWAIGSSLIVEPGTVRQEILPIGGTSSSAVTTNAGALYFHAGTASLVYAITPYVTTVRADRGAS